MASKQAKGAQAAPAEALSDEERKAMLAEAARFAASEVARLAAPAPQVGNVALTKEKLAQATAMRALVASYIRDNMVEGDDFGWAAQDLDPKNRRTGAKQVLLKPGAEKLFDLFEARPEYEYVDQERDHAQGLFYFELRCRAVHRPTGTVLNEGLGSCSSFESKYRYRNADRICPACGGAFIKRSKRPGEGWYCFGKIGGCGAQFPADDPGITEQASGRITNPDLADVANTVLKMAKKRAQVDCAIGLARCSDLFTQDLEEEGPAGEETVRKTLAQAKAVNQAGGACEECHAPAGKPHATSCSRKAAKPAEPPKEETKPAEPPKEETKPAEPPKEETKPAPADDPAYKALVNRLLEGLEKAEKSGKQADLSAVASEIVKVSPEKGYKGPPIPGKLLPADVEHLRTMYKALQAAISKKANGGGK